MLSIYKASAGSGKTHTLTGFYLKLAFEQPTKFREILAVTFTNKAAGEMKGRIVEELASLAQQGEQSDHYDTIAEAFPKFTPEEIQQQAQLILESILHSYSDFAIGTIDSFVQKVLRSFAFEIGIHSGYAIEFDTQKVTDELTALLYEKLHNDPQLLKWLVDFANFKINEGKNWDFRKEVVEFTNEIFKETFQKVDIGRLENRQERLEELHKVLQKEKRDFWGSLKSISEEAKVVTEKNQLNPKFNRNVGYVFDYLLKHIVNQKDPKKLMPNNTVLTMQGSAVKWARKTDNMSEVQAIFELINPLLEQALQEVEQNYGRFLVINNLLGNFYNLGIAFELASLLPDYREQNNLMLISDSNQLLREIVSDNDAPFIYEKIGNYYKNILIDEFQDTSSFQWENFKPLLHNSIAEGTDNLIVGDIKQSIYRWRGGDWNLLLSQVKKDILSTQEFNLATNWRSRPNIVNYNNALFSLLPELLSQSESFKHDNELLQKLKLDLLNAYSDVQQEVAPPKAKYPGEVKINFVEVKSRLDYKKKWREELAERIPQEIERLLDNGVAPRDIAILTRKNSDGKAIVEMLLSHMKTVEGARQYSIISNEALSIQNSDSIKILIAALRVLYDTNDYLSWASLSSFFPQDEEKRFGFFLHRETQEKPIVEIMRGYLPDAFLDMFHELRMLGLLELGGQLQRIFELQQEPTFWPYLQAFEDILLEFSEQKAGDLAGFLDWWDHRGSQRSLQLSDKQDAVRVTTIHKSKGLAFKVVLVPFCDWDFETGRSDTLFWVEANDLPFSLFPAIPLKYTKDLSQSPMADSYFQEHVYQLIDALNMLYVAFTRPKDSLLVWAPIAPKKANELKCVSDALYLAADSAITNGLVNFEQADAFSFEMDGQFPDSDNLNESGNLELPEYRISTWRNKLSLVRQSSEFFLLTDQERAEKVNYGNLMHEIFSKIETFDDVDEVLGSMRWEGRIGGMEVTELKEQVHEIVNRSQISHWFDPKWTVHTEKAIISAQGNIRIPDRVMKHGNEIIIVDFKFGEQNDEYIAQVKEYADLLKDIESGEDVTGFIYYANSDVLVEVS